MLSLFNCDLAFQINHVPADRINKNSLNIVSEYNQETPSLIQCGNAERKGKKKRLL